MKKTNLKDLPSVNKVLIELNNSVFVHDDFFLNYNVQTVLMYIAGTKKGASFPNVFNTSKKISSKNSAFS